MSAQAPRYIESNELVYRFNEDSSSDNTLGVHQQKAKTSFKWNISFYPQLLVLQKLACPQGDDAPNVVFLDQIHILNILHCRNDNLESHA